MLNSMIYIPKVEKKGFSYFLFCFGDPQEDLPTIGYLSRLMLRGKRIEKMTMVSYTNDCKTPCTRVLG